MIEGVKEMKEGSLNLRRIIDLTFHCIASHFDVIIERLTVGGRENVACKRTSAAVERTASSMLCVGPKEKAETKY